MFDLILIHLAAERKVISGPGEFRLDNCGVTFACADIQERTEFRTHRRPDNQHRFGLALQFSCLLAHIGIIKVPGSAGFVCGRQVKSISGGNAEFWKHLCSFSDPGRGVDF